MSYRIIHGGVITEDNADAVVAALDEAEGDGWRCVGLTTFADTKRTALVMHKPNPPKKKAGKDG